MVNDRVAVIVSTYGDPLWAERAERALLSVEHQTCSPDEVHAVHSHSLASARNQGAETAKSDWLIFLDADDELDPFYVAAMMDAAQGVTQDVLWQPATLGVYEDGTEDDCPVLIPRRPLLESNFMIIGTMVRREQFLRVGGFRELPICEDWDAWLRCWIDGAVLETVPKAIYRVGVRENSRNQDQQHVFTQTYMDIRMRYRAEAQARGLA